MKTTMAAIMGLTQAQLVAKIEATNQRAKNRLALQKAAATHLRKASPDKDAGLSDSSPQPKPLRSYRPSSYSSKLARSRQYETTWRDHYANPYRSDL